MSSHHTSLPSTLTTSDDPPSFRAIQDPVTIPNVARDAGAASTVPKTTDNTSGAPPSLVQGYKQVESFGPSEDYVTDEEVDEEETVYVTLDLGNIEPTLVPSSTSYRLVGLETPTPYLQLSGTIFKGTHNELLGSELLFTDDTTQDWSKRTLTHVTNTSHRITFKEVRLTPKPLPQTGEPIASLPSTFSIPPFFSSDASFLGSNLHSFPSGSNLSTQPNPFTNSGAHPTTTPPSTSKSKAKSKSKKSKNKGKQKQTAAEQSNTDAYIAPGSELFFDSADGMAGYHHPESPEDSFIGHSGFGGGFGFSGFDPGFRSGMDIGEGPSGSLYTMSHGPRNDFEDVDVDMFGT